MGDEFVPRKEYTEGQGRVHKRIDDINLSSVRIDESTKRQEEMVKEMHTIVYGNGGRDGLMTKVSNIFKTLQIHWFILSVILLGLISLSWKAFIQ